MEELFIPYSLSVIAKEKGFNEECFGYWTSGGKSVKNETTLYIQFTRFKNDALTVPSAILYQQILDWLMKEHKIYVQILPFAKYFRQEWQYELLRLTISEFKSPEREGYNAFIKLNDFIFSSYGEALNKGIEEALKLI